MAEDEYEIPMMSTGQASTLGNWHAMCVAMLGADSPATQFIKAKMDEQGEGMPVITDEGQLLYTLLMMHADAEEEE